MMNNPAVVDEKRKPDASDVRDNLITKCCQECPDHHDDDCADHECFVWEILGILMEANDLFLKTGGDTPFPWARLAAKAQDAKTRAEIVKKLGEEMLPASSLLGYSHGGYFITELTWQEIQELDE